MFKSRTGTKVLWCLKIPILFLTLLASATVFAGVFHDNGGPINRPGAGTGGYGTVDNFTLAEDHVLQDIHWWGDCSGGNGCSNATMTIDIFLGRPMPDFFSIPPIPPEDLANLIHTFRVGTACTVNLGPHDHPAGRDLFACSAQVPDTLLSGGQEYWIRIKDDKDLFSWALSTNTGVDGAFQGGRSTDHVFFPTGVFRDVAFNLTGDIPESCVAPPSGLVSWWPLDESSGTTTADIVDSNPGVVNGEAVFVAGKVGNALDFDGMNDTVEIAHSANLKPSTEITIDAWIKPNRVNALLEIFRKEDGNDRSLLSFQDGSQFCGNLGQGSMAHSRVDDFWIMCSFR